MNGDPAVFLKSAPSDAGRLLTQQVDRHDGAHVPWWMFSEVAVRQRQLAMWIGAMEGLFKKVRRHAMAGLATLAINLVAIGGYALHRASESGASTERENSLQGEIANLRLDIRALWAAMRRMSGAGPEHPESDIGYSPDPDKLSDLAGGWSAILAAGLPPPKPKSSCGATCNSSIECSFGVLKPCPFCNFGICKSTRPELPTDAGVVDAPP